MSQELTSGKGAGLPLYGRERGTQLDDPEAGAKSSEKAPLVPARMVALSDQRLHCYKQLRAAWPRIHLQTACQSDMQQEAHREKGGTFAPRPHVQPRSSERCISLLL